MREIGSEFWTGSTPLSGSGVAALLPQGFASVYTLCGRTALELAVEDALAERRIQSAYLPSYCCHTMIEPFVSHGIRVTFYTVRFSQTGLCADFDADNDCDLVFLMDYFGFHDDQTFCIAAQQHARGKMVLYDATHSLFRQDNDYTACDYVFGSFRKWFGVNAGFGAKHGTWHFPPLGRNRHYTDLRNSAFDMKKQYIENETGEKSRFLDAFRLAEEQLETHYHHLAPDGRSERSMAAVHTGHVRTRRRENAAALLQGLKTIGTDVIASVCTEIGAEDAPLFLPLRVKDGQRDPLRAYLIRNGIYLPVHWPVSDLHRADASGGEVYMQELSCVCDQRYGAADMEKIIVYMRRFLQHD